MNKFLLKGSILIGLALPIFAVALHAGADSGPKVGAEVYAFEPTHVTGPDKGTNTCPVCKYGKEPAAQVWVNGDNPSNVAVIAKTLESAIDKYGLKKFRAFVVMIPNKEETPSQLKETLSAFAATNSLDKVALTYVDGPKADAVDEYQINTDASVKNTVLVYADKQVVAKYVNLKGDDDSVSKLQASIASAVSKGK